MAEVKFSAAARSDLARIDAFSADQFGDDVADTYTRGLSETFALLRRYPEIGEARPDYGKDVRCRIYRSHRIVYRIGGDTVFVQRILHHSQNVPVHLPYD